MELELGTWEMSQGSGMTQGSFLCPWRCEQARQLPAVVWWMLRQRRLPHHLGTVEAAPSGGAPCGPRDCCRETKGSLGMSTGRFRGKQLPP